MKRLCTVFVACLLTVSCASEPAPTSTPVPTNTLTATLMPPPKLESPASGAGLTREIVYLRWTWLRALASDEYSDVRLWREGEPAHKAIAWAKESSCVVRGLEAGKYHWSVLVLRHTGTNTDGTKMWEPVSVESEVRWFTYSPPLVPTTTTQD